MNQWLQPAPARPRLVLLTLDFLPGVGGVQEYLYQIGQRLAETYDVTVVTPISDPLSGSGPLPGSGLLPEPARLQRVVVPATPLAFWQHLRHLRPAQVLVGHAHPRLLLAAAFYGRYSAIAYGNDFLAAQKRWHRLLFNRLLARAAPLITISQASSLRLQQLGLPKPLIVRPGVDPQRFTPFPRRLDEEPPTLLTVGRLVGRKGIDTVLQSLPALLAEFPDLRYLIGGDGPDRQRLEQLAQRLGVTPAVSFLGKIDPAALPHLYRQADIFIMPARAEEENSSVEGFGIVYLEASASSLPVIAGHSGGSAEAVRDGQTGLLIPPDDPARAVEAASRLLRDPVWRRQLGANGRCWIEAEMNWNRAGEEMLSALLPGSGRRS